MTKQEKQAEMDSLLTLLAYLKNGGNDYSAIGRERQMMEQCDVDAAITQLENEIALVMGANCD